MPAATPSATPSDTARAEDERAELEQRMRAAERHYESVGSDR
jgi:hypothetical protein